MFFWLFQGRLARFVWFFAQIWKMASGRLLASQALGALGSSLAGQALLWELSEVQLYRQKLPINRTAAVMLEFNISTQLLYKHQITLQASDYYNITAAVRLIGSFCLYNWTSESSQSSPWPAKELPRAPRAALGLPRAVQWPFSKFDRKTIRIVRDVPEKVKKTSRESAVPSIFAVI